MLGEVALPEGELLGGLDVAAGDGVLNGRVGLKHHVRGQAVGVDAGDQRTLGGLSRFAFDDRGERDDLGQRHTANSGLSAQRLVDATVELAKHRLDDIARGGLRVKFVRLGEEVALEARRVGIGWHQTVLTRLLDQTEDLLAAAHLKLVGAASDLLGTPALDHGETLTVGDGAAGQDGDNLGG